MNPALFSSAKDDWETPDDLFQSLFDKYRFDVDVCATPENAKLPRFITPEQNGLTTAWRSYGTIGWCNPPYTKGQQRAWVEKALHERATGFTTVLLLPARTDTRLFHDLIWDGCLSRPRGGIELQFVRGRLRFVGAPSPAPFPSMVVIVHPLK